MTGQLRRRGHRVGHNRVARLMANNGLVGAHARHTWHRRRHPPRSSPDLLQRDFTTDTPDRRWVADISEFACWDGKLYLADIRDLCDRTRVGWSMGERQTTDLIVAALVMALGAANPTRSWSTRRHGSQGGLGRSDAQRRRPARRPRARWLLGHLQIPRLVTDSCPLTPRAVARLWRLQTSPDRCCSEPAASDPSTRVACAMPLTVTHRVRFDRRGTTTWSDPRQRR